jgi:hypothetical protein
MRKEINVNHLLQRARGRIRRLVSTNHAAASGVEAVPSQPTTEEVSSHLITEEVAVPAATEELSEQPITEEATALAATEESSEQPTAENIASDTDEIAENRMSLPPNALLMDDYYHPLNPVPRYGYGLPQHKEIRLLLEQGIPRYREMLTSFRAFIPQFLSIPKDLDPERTQEPAWMNGFFPALDIMSLFGLISTMHPRQYLEVGSGNSTKVAAMAKRLNSPETTIRSIDPAPRAEIDALCNAVIREPLESADLDVFTTLAANDILFIDGSHRVFQNSDVAVVFLEILPRLQSGVWIHVHDIFWPDDYPPSWEKRYYSEQYMLGMLLLFAPEQYEVVLPNRFIAYHTDIPTVFNDLWEAAHLEGAERHGVSFWLRKV